MVPEVCVADVGLSKTFILRSRPPREGETVIDGTNLRLEGLPHGNGDLAGRMAPRGDLVSR